MDITEQKQDEAVNNIIKVYLAQMNSAIKISDIICNHSKDEDEITGDHIISGLIYRLMVPMTDDDMAESLEKAAKFMNESTSEEEYDDDTLLSWAIHKNKGLPTLKAIIKSDLQNMRIVF